MQESPGLTRSPSFNSYSNPELVGIAARVVRELGSDEFCSDRQEDFDFDSALVTRNMSSQIPADEIFEDGKIRTVYPVKCPISESERPKIRGRLGELFIEEREASTSSEADEMDGAEERRWKKSASAGGNSRRLMLKDLMSRSNSEGSMDAGVVILKHANSARKKEDGKEAAADGGKGRPPPLSSRDGGEKMRSYLPYRVDLVGFFGSANGFRKKSKPY